MDFLRRDLPFDIETEDFDAQVIFAFHRFLTCVELLSFVNIFTAGITSPVHCVSASASI